MKTFILFPVFLFIISTNMYAQSYRGAELRTHESFTYGRFEVRYKAAAGSGVLSNFFTYHDYTSPCCEEWNEIDIEILGRYTNDIQTTTITPGQKIQNSHTNLKFSPTDSFYTYAFEWTPEYVAWFVDGKEIYRQTGEHVSTLVYGQKIMMNIWASEWENWVGTWNDRQLPFFAYYDWVAYYTYTPGSGDSGTGENFTFSWKDDFESYDAGRWGKATHTFNGNRVLFTKENIVYKDGMMILCLTDDTNLGYVDKVAPGLMWARLNKNIITARFTENINADDAVELGKYSITPSVNIVSVELLKDKRTVRLLIDEALPEQNYKLIIFGIQDIFQTPNTQAYDVVDIVHNKPLSFPIKINTGSDISYKDYLADQSWGYETEYGHMDGYHRKYYNLEVNGTEQDSLYQAQLEEVVQYKIRVPNGVYNIQLGFAELDLNTVGKRKFDLWVEDTLVFYDLDLVRDLGFAQVASYDVKKVHVSDGIIDIYFNNWTSHPVINSIVVDQLATSLPDNKPILPHKTGLGQNYPNPFNPQTTITLYLESKSFMELDVYNLLGKKVKRIFAGEKGAGQYKFNLNSQNLSSGVYFYRLNARTSKGVITEYKKMLVVK